MHSEIFHVISASSRNFLLLSNFPLIETTELSPFSENSTAQLRDFHQIGNFVNIFQYFFVLEGFRAVGL